MINKKVVSQRTSPIPDEISSQALDLCAKITGKPKERAQKLTTLYVTLLFKQNGPLAKLVALAREHPQLWTLPNCKETLERLEALFGLAPLSESKTTRLAEYTNRLEEFLTVGQALNRLTANHHSIFSSKFAQLQDRLSIALTLQQTLGENYSDSCLEEANIQKMSKAITGSDMSVHFQELADLPGAITGLALEATFASFAVGKPDIRHMRDIAFVPNLSHLPEADKAKLNILYETLYPDSSEKDPLTHWAQIICAVQQTALTTTWILSIFSEGPTGAALDQHRSTFSNFHQDQDPDAPLKKADLSIGRMIKNIREQKELAGTQYTQAVQTRNEANQVKFQADIRRWEMAECRLGDTLVLLTSHQQKTPMTPAQEKDVAECLARWETIVKDACSVGQDFKLGSLPRELEAILLPQGKSEAPNKEEAARVLSTDCSGWVSQMASQTLASIGVPDRWQGDVHHVNHVLRVICVHLKLPVPAQLSDPHRPAFGDVIERQGSTACKLFHKPWAFLVDRWTDTHRNPEESRLSRCFSDVVEGGYVSETPLIELTPAQKAAFLEHSMKRLSLSEIKDILKAKLVEQDLDDAQLVQQIHQELIAGGEVHGLLGIAAKAGNFECFAAFYPHLISTVSQLESFAFSQDAYGMTLIEQAVLGGSDDCFTFLRAQFTTPNASGDSLQAKWIEQMKKVVDRSQQENRASLPILAAESGNVKMLKRITADLNKILGSAECLDLMKKPDAKGFTPLMKAVLSKSILTATYVAQCLSGENPDPSVAISGINDANLEGQTALHMAADLAQPKMIALLMRLGSDPSCPIPKSNETPLHLVMKSGSPDCLRAMTENFTDGDFMRIDYEELITSAATRDVVLLYAELVFEKAPEVTKSAFFWPTLVKSRHLTEADLVYLFNLVREKHQPSSNTYQKFLLQIAGSKKLSRDGFLQILPFVLDNHNRFLMSTFSMTMVHLAASKSFSAQDWKKLFLDAVDANVSAGNLDDTLRHMSTSELLKKEDWKALFESASIKNCPSRAFTLILIYFFDSTPPSPPSESVPLFKKIIDHAHHVDFALLLNGFKGAVRRHPEMELTWTEWQDILSYAKETQIPLAVRVSLLSIAVPTLTDRATCVQIVKECIDDKLDERSFDTILNLSRSLEKEDCEELLAYAKAQQAAPSTLSSVVRLCIRGHVFNSEQLVALFKETLTQPLPHDILERQLLEIAGSSQLDTSDLKEIAQFACRSTLSRRTATEILREAFKRLSSSEIKDLFSSALQHFPEAKDVLTLFQYVFYAKNLNHQDREALMCLGFDQGFDKKLLTQFFEAIFNLRTFNDHADFFIKEVRSRALAHQLDASVLVHFKGDLCNRAPAFEEFWTNLICLVIEQHLPGHLHIPFLQTATILGVLREASFDEILQVGRTNHLEERQLQFIERLKSKLADS